ncbi:hypothetical protein D1872_258140 [compost metagenome]
MRMVISRCPLIIEILRQQNYIGILRIIGRIHNHIRLTIRAVFVSQYPQSFHFLRIKQARFVIDQGFVLC